MWNVVKTDIKDCERQAEETKWAHSAKKAYVLGGRQAFLVLQEGFSDRTELLGDCRWNLRLRSLRHEARKVRRRLWHFRSFGEKHTQQRITRSVEFGMLVDFFSWKFEKQLNGKYCRDTEKLWKLSIKTLCDDELAKQPKTEHGSATVNCPEVWPQQSWGGHRIRQNRQVFLCILPPFQGQILA